MGNLPPYLLNATKHREAKTCIILHLRHTRAGDGVSHQPQTGTRSEKQTVGKSTLPPIFAVTCSHNLQSSCRSQELSSYWLKTVLPLTTERCNTAAKQKQTFVVVFTECQKTNNYSLVGGCGNFIPALLTFLQMICVVTRDAKRGWEGSSEDGPLGCRQGSQLFFFKRDATGSNTRAGRAARFREGENSVSALETPEGSGF